MNDSIYREIENNRCFKKLVQKRGRFVWLLSLITLALYVGFIFLIAFERHCCKDRDDVAFGGIEKSYLSKTLLTRRPIPS